MSDRPPRRARRHGEGSVSGETLRPGPGPDRVRAPLPDLETLLDALDPFDECADPDPEEGDFWIDPEEEWQP